MKTDKSGFGRSPGRVEIEYYDDNDLTALAQAVTSRARAASATP